MNEYLNNLYKTQKQSIQTDDALGLFVKRGDCGYYGDLLRP